MKQCAALLFILIGLFSSCKSHKSVVVQEEEKPYIPKYLVLSVGAVDLKDQKEGQSILTHDQLGADRCEFHSLQVGKDAWIHATTIADKIEVGGEGRFYGSRVRGEAKIEGKLYAHCAQFSSCVDVGDDVTAVDSVFQGTLQAKAEIIDLTNVKAQSIFVKATGPYYDKQLVYIKGNTVIEGDVTFESERGRVIYDIHSQVKGSIRGGHSIPSYECDRMILESNFR